MQCSIRPVSLAHFKMRNDVLFCDRGFNKMIIITTSHKSAVVDNLMEPKQNKKYVSFSFVQRLLPPPRKKEIIKWFQLLSCEAAAVNSEIQSAADTKKQQTCEMAARSLPADT